MTTAAPPEMFYVGTDPQNRARLVWFHQQERDAHGWVKGASGSGKSSLLLDILCQDAVAGRGVVLFDPKGDLANDFVAALTCMPEESWRALARDLVIVDPADPACAVRFNPLELAGGRTASRQTEDIVSVFRKVWDLDANTPRLELVLRRSVQLAMHAGLSLPDVPRLLVDGELRERLLAGAPEALRRFWRDEFPESRSAQQAWAMSTLTRLEVLLDDPAVCRFFSARRSTFDFRDIMDRGAICVVNLAKGSLGEETSRLLGGLLLTRLQLAAEGRVSLPASQRRTCYAVFDEAQNYATRSFEELLAEARGYGLSITFAHQNLGQLGEPLRRALTTNTRLKMVFRTSHEDARVLAPELWRFDGRRVKISQLAFANIGKLPIPYMDQTFHTSGDEARQNREALAYLPDRFLWVHVAGEAAPQLVRTVDLPLDELRQARDRVCALKALVRARDMALQGGEPQQALPPIAGPHADERFNWRPDSSGDAA